MRSKRFTVFPFLVRCTKMDIYMQVSMDLFSALFACGAHCVLVVRKAIWIPMFFQENHGTILVKDKYVLVIALVR